MWERFTTSLYNTVWFPTLVIPSFQQCFLHRYIYNIYFCVRKRISRGGPTCETLRSLTMFDFLHFLHFQYLYIFVYLRKRISRGELTCETLRPSSLLVLQLGLARQVEGDLDVLGVVNSEDVETLTPGDESVEYEVGTQIHTIISAPDIEYCKGKWRYHKSARAAIFEVNLRCIWKSKWRVVAVYNQLYTLWKL